MTRVASDDVRSRPFGRLPAPLSWVMAVALCLVLAGVVAAAAFATRAALGLPRGGFGMAVALGIVNLPLPFWMTLANFLTAPLFQLLHVYTYYSPLLLAERRRGGRLALHGGTLFDYVKHMRWADRGRTATRRVLVFYLQGLLALIAEIEEGRLSGDVVISATSFFFSARHAQRFGFTAEEKRLQALGGVLVYPTLVLTYSYTKGHLAFPNLSHTVSAHIRGAELVAQKELITTSATRIARLLRGDSRGASQAQPSD